jgi:hypothetical protein
MTIEIPQWTFVTKEEEATKVRFAICVDDTVQQIMEVNLAQAALWVLNPVVVRCNDLATPGDSRADAVAGL